MPDNDNASPAVALRYMEEADLPDVLECEYESHAWVDPDFDTRLLPDYAWDEAALRAAAGQYRSAALGTHDTRALVAEVMVEVTDAAGLTEASPWLCGCVLYELKPLGYEILLLTAHPLAPPGVRRELLLHLVGKARRSEDRKRISAAVADGDWKTLGFLQDEEFTLELVPNPRGNDVWLMEHEVLDDEDAEKTAA